MLILSNKRMQSLEEEFQVTEWGVWGRDTNNWLSWPSASWLQYIIAPPKYISLVMEISD